jgi:hypothetical protein
LTSGNLRVEPRFPWFVRVGLPMPQRLSVDQGGLGGRVRCELSVGVAFASITQWQPDRSFAFDVLRYDIQDQPFHITRLGRGPDYGFRRERIEDWLTLLDTSYSLEPAGAGRTLLRRRVVWRRHLAPGVYFGWLQQTVMEHSQRRLLELIRSRAEALDESSILLARRAGP